MRTKTFFIVIAVQLVNQQQGSFFCMSMQQKICNHLFHVLGIFSRSYLHLDASHFCVFISYTYIEKYWELKEAFISNKYDSIYHRAVSKTIQKEINGKYLWFIICYIFDRTATNKCAHTILFVFVPFLIFIYWHFCD